MAPRNPPATPRPRPGRAPERRNAGARIAILHAADDLLAERGFNGLTVEGIAERAGVAKQTIYRWWPSKVEILFDTLRDDAATALAVPAQDSALAELGERLRRLSTFLNRDPAGKVLLALVGQAQHDEATAATLEREFFAPQRTEDRARVRRAAAAGELSGELSADELLDALYGPVYLRALAGRAPFTRAGLARLLALA